MRTIVKRSAAALLLLLAVLLPASAAGAEGNLLQNPGFEDGAAGWGKDLWIDSADAAVMTIQSEVVRSGNYAAMIENVQPNHLKWVQPVDAEPDALYRISGWVKVERIAGSGFGANLFPVGVADGYPAVGEPDDWQYLEFIGQTGANQDTFTLGAALGGYTKLVQGKAYFDDLAVEKLDSIPAGASVVSLDPAPVAESAGNEGGIPHPVSPAMLIVLSGVFSVFFVLLYRSAFRSERLMRRPEADYSKGLYAALAAAFLLRLWLGYTAQGFQSDMNTFISWGERVKTLGPGGFYEEGYFADYPPGYLYVLWLLSALKDAFGLVHGSGGENLLFKLPAIVSDLVLGGLIFSTARRKLGGGIALGLALLFLFNPAVLINSSVWGQADAFFMIFLLLSIRGAADKRLIHASLWFALAVLVKPQAFIFTPVLLLAFWHQRAWKQLAWGAACGLGLLLALASPFFWGNGGLAGMVNLYKATLSSYPYSTVNAFNLFALTDPMWSPLDSTWLGISYRIWGMIAILFAVATAGHYSFHGDRKNAGKAYFIGMLLIVIVFVLGSKMHERYMFPALALTLFAFIDSKDRRFLTLFLGFSLTHYINVGYTLDYLNIGSHPTGDGIVILCSIANLALLLYMLLIGYRVYLQGRIQELAPLVTQGERSAADVRAAEQLRPLPAAKGEAKARLRRKDWLWMSGITAVYTAVALFNLGSFVAPQTLWKPAAAGESFYFDLGQSRQLERISVFGGVGTGKYHFEFGETPAAWDGRLDIDQDVGNVFIWKNHATSVQARYVKLTVDQPGFRLHELALFEQGQPGVPLPVAAITAEEGGAGSEGEPSLLFDEQKTVPERTSFMNSTYFDEIYHARTAYEHANGIVPYENTHPPLGKLLIAVGMEWFGVNPFGWRIIGTLFGAAMLPLLYMMAFRLFKRTEYAALAAGLFALDFMHFVQTRIATIDVYGVFFIMLMFYFMHRYTVMNFYRTPLLKTLVPLFWAGLFFGIGVASKWIVLYGGAGLAIMLAVSLTERYLEHRGAKRALQNGMLGDSELAAAAGASGRTFWTNTLITLAVCVVFFVIIPLGVYSASFIPVLNVTTDGFTLKGLIDAQSSMFNYHSQLVATHPFSSSWWEWPFMKRPVWFYSGGDGVGPGLTSSIVTIGNPLIWWTGIFALIAAVYFSIRRRDKSVYMLWIAFLSQYIPWMLVPRETFLYHYFAMVPFMILGIVYVVKLFEEKFPRLSYLKYVYVAGAAVLFILFYPVLSGMTVNVDYVNWGLRWFPSWVF